MAVPLKKFYHKFHGFFCDTEGVQYTVAIETEEVVSDIKTIRLGATPFVVDCDADENYFKPVRTRTAKLTVIDEDGTLYDQIMPKDNFSTQVELLRGGKIISKWFVSCETFENPLFSRPAEVTFNLNGFLAMTEFIQADPVYSNTSPFYGMLNSIAKGFNDVGISYYTDFWIQKINSLYALIDYSWFFETKKYKDVNGDRIEIVGKSVLSIIEAFCKFYGFVAVEMESGGVIFVNDLNLADYFRYSLTYGQLPKVTLGDNTLAHNTVQLQNLTLMGKNHTVNTIRPAKSVSVVSKIDEYNNKMQLPSFASKAYIFGNIASDDNTKQCHSLLSNMENISGTLIMGKPRAFLVNIKKALSSANSYYVNEYTITYNGESQVPYDPYASFLYIGPYNYPICKNWDNICESSFHSKADELTNANVWCGAFMARAEVYEGQMKASYNLTDFLVVCGLCYSAINDLQPTFPEQFSKMKAATLRSENIVKIYNGFINIKAAAIMVDYFGNFDDADGVIMNFQLKIGNRYYNGSEWTEDESFFPITFNDGHILTNKNAYWQTTEENGYFIEIPVGQYQEGIVELSVSPAMWKSNTNDGKLPMCAMFSDLSVNFTYKASDLAFGDKENHYFCLLDAGAKDEIEVENDIASDYYNKAAENVIKKQYSFSPEQIDEVLGVKLELLLLSRMNEYYSQKRKILSLEVSNSARYSGFNIYYVEQDGKTYFPFGYSIDYKANKVNLKLFEQPDYPEDIIP